MNLDKGIHPNTLEWQQCRIGKITASQVFKIFVSGQGKDNLMGVGAMTYLNQKIGEILTQTMYDDIPETEDILRGLGNEQFALERYSEITGEIVQDSLLFEYNAIACGTNDGEIIYPSGEIKAILEVKCPRPHKHIQICAIEAAIELKAIDKQYYGQCQANMMFTDAEYADFISYSDAIKHYDLQIRIIRIYPDQQWRKDFIERIGWIAEYFVNQIEKILKAPERNLAYRLEQKPEAINKLQSAIESIQSIKI